MSTIMDTVLYCKSLENILGQVAIDTYRGEKREARKLFYPLGISEGNLAFELFKKRIDQAQIDSNRKESPELIKENIRLKIGRAIKQIETGQIDSEHAKAPQSIRKEIQRKIIATAMDVRAAGRPIEIIGDENQYLAAQIRATTNKGKRDTNLDNQVLPTIIDPEEKTVDATTNKDKKGANLETPPLPTVIHHGEEIDAATDEKINRLDDNSVEGYNILLEEPLSSRRHSLMWVDENTGNLSRVIALASAGYGKTTLINRIALFYVSCLQNEMVNADKAKLEREFRHQYNLLSCNSQGEPLIPCIIRLRDYNVNTSIMQAIIASVESFVSIHDSGAIEKWVQTIQSRLLLLIDGVDELDDPGRDLFLDALSLYLAKNPTTGVIMTSRVAGLSQDRAKQRLVDLGFHGRTIMPLDDENAIWFCRQWIDVTQEEDQAVKNASLKLISQIQTQKKYKYLRELLSTPLELISILTQIISGYSFSNRWELFRSILFSQFTNHVNTMNQQRVFDDTMLLLSSIAYYMQINGSLYLSKGDIEQLLPSIQRLNFQTQDFIDFSVDSIWSKLDLLSSNITIIEKDDTRDVQTFTFPIRAYHEFLTAYACCTLRIDPSEQRPYPSKAILPHINNSQWIDIVIYALSYMKENASLDYEDFKSEIFRTCDNVDMVINVVQNVLSVSADDARSICKRFFSDIMLTPEQKLQLVDCLRSESGYSFRKALFALYKGTCDSNPWIYSEAVAYAYIISAEQEHDSTIATAISMLKRDSSVYRCIGASMLALFARMMLQEEQIKIDDDIRVGENEIDETVISMLVCYADAYRTSLYLHALTELWLAKIEGCEKIPSYISQEHVELVCSEVQRISLSSLLGDGKLNLCTALYFRRLFYILGAFPINTLLEPARICNVWQRSLLACLYEQSRGSFTIDQTGLAVATMYFGGSIDEFMRTWVWDICRGIDSNKVRKDAKEGREGTYTYREQNHFALLREEMHSTEGMELLERSYRRVIQSTMNTLDPLDIVLFDNDTPLMAVIERAVAYYCNRFGKRRDPIINQIILAAKGDRLLSDSSASTNLAFLIRNGNLPVPKIFVDRPTFLRILLQQGVANDAPYSLLNLALLEFELGNKTQAELLCEKITREGWQDTVMKWWRPELWDKKQTREGAFVCLLGQKYANMSFPDMAELKSTLAQTENPISLEEYCTKDIEDEGALANPQQS